MGYVLRRLHRERRRLALFAAAVLVCAFIWSIGAAPDKVGSVTLITLCLSITLVATLLAALIALTLPAARHGIEAAACVLLIGSLIVVASDFHIALSGAGILTLVTLFLLALPVVQALLYGSWSDDRFRLRTQSESGAATSSVSRATAWDLILPAPDKVMYWDATVTHIRHMKGKAGQRGEVLMLYHRLADGRRLEQQLRLDKAEPEKALRYYFSIPAATNGAETEQACSFALETRGSGVIIRARWDRSNYPLRRALRHWLDDWPGRSLDTVISRIESMAAEQRKASLHIGPLTRRRDGKSGI